MVRRFVPVVRRRVGVIVLGVMTGLLSAGVVQAQDAPKANPYVFAGDGAVLLNFIKADHVADFEMILGKLKEALAKSEKPERKQQAESWKVFKANEAGPAGAAIYVSVIYPSVKGADYTVTTILAEAFPTEVQDLYKKYADSFATPPGNLLNIKMFSDLAK
ncbi:MAG: hypothetical protein ABMA15_28305 [Vicinamibacterales bacterium]